MLYQTVCDNQLPTPILNLSAASEYTLDINPYSGTNTETIPRLAASTVSSTVQSHASSSGETSRVARVPTIITNDDLVSDETDSRVPASSGGSIDGQGRIDIFHRLSPVNTAGSFFVSPTVSHDLPTTSSAAATLTNSEQFSRARSTSVWHEVDENTDVIDLSGEYETASSGDQGHESDEAFARRLQVKPYGCYICESENVLLSVIWYTNVSCVNFSHKKALDIEA